MGNAPGAGPLHPDSSGLPAQHTADKCTLLRVRPQAFDDASLRQLPACSPQGLANMIGAMAACGHVPPADWVELYWAQSRSRLSAYAHEDITGTVVAATRLGLRPPDPWVTAACQALAQPLARAPDTPPSARQLAEHLRALALLRRAGVPADVVRATPQLLHAWLEHAGLPACMQQFSAVDAAHSLWAMAALQLPPDGAWLQRLLLHCRPRLRACPAGHLALMLWSLSALRYCPTWSWQQVRLLCALHGPAPCVFACMCVRMRAGTHAHARLPKRRLMQRHTRACPRTSCTVMPHRCRSGRGARRCPPVQKSHAMHHVAPAPCFQDGRSSTSCEPPMALPRLRASHSHHAAAHTPQPQC